MADPRIDTVLATLRDNGVNAAHDDLDTLATKIVNALDREHGAGAGETEAAAANNPGDTNDAPAVEADSGAITPPASPSTSS